MVSAPSSSPPASFDAAESSFAPACLDDRADTQLHVVTLRGHVIDAQTRCACVLRALLSHMRCETRDAQVDLVSVMRALLLQMRSDILDAQVQLTRVPLEPLLEPRGHRAGA